MAQAEGEVLRGRSLTWEQAKVSSGLHSIRRTTVTQLRAHLRMVSSYGHSQAAGTGMAPPRLLLSTGSVGNGAVLPFTDQPGKMQEQNAVLWLSASSNIAWGLQLPLLLLPFS